MTTPGSDPNTDIRAMLRSVGIDVTDEGMTRARNRLRKAAERHTPEMRAAWREALGLPAEA